MSSGLLYPIAILRGARPRSARVPSQTQVFKKGLPSDLRENIEHLVSIYVDQIVTYTLGIRVCQKEASRDAKNRSRRIGQTTHLAI